VRIDTGVLRAWPLLSFGVGASLEGSRTLSLYGVPARSLLRSADGHPSLRVDLRDGLRKVLGVSPVSSRVSGRSNAFWALQRRLAGARRGVLAAVLATVIVAVVGCGSSHPRTQVLKSALPGVSDIYVRITGPGGAVSYIVRRFRTGDAFSRFSFSDASREGLFLPPDVRDRKLCSSTHIIRRGDAPELQKWRGRTLEVTIYGKKISAIYCAVLGSDIYLGAS
jgi:hypothetical protein